MFIATHWEFNYLNKILWYFKVADKSNHYTDKVVNDCCRLNKNLLVFKTFL